mmetsp:Transcript_14602/g.29422  ORF Transcript_14602/g.29422 Transcript_14602/m.29422 type:complete len:113 (-) Transcript_14602:470-808(-)
MQRDALAMQMQFVQVPNSLSDRTVCSVFVFVCPQLYFSPFAFFSLQSSDRSMRSSFPSFFLHCPKETRQGKQSERASEKVRFRFGGSEATFSFHQHAGPISSFNERIDRSID